MKSFIRKHTLPSISKSLPFRPGITPVLNALRRLKQLPAAVRRFYPRPRKFYSRKEEQAYKIAMEIKKTRFPGNGPPF